ncbi:hypothetical protein C8R44DRAFT_238342 [Mycena epipterygia]|nr:hypothetical protein C8R44DRAFT_238342 [Mycena epipterygia]
MTKPRSRLQFIIVGASTAGLASAIALKAAGHDILVLEKESQLGGPDSIPTGGVRLPPNGCKILFDWGLEAEIRANAIVGAGFTVYKYDDKNEESGRDYIGTNLWDPELLSDARGDFLQMRHKDLLRILYDAMMRFPSEKTEDNHDSAPTVSIKFGAEVVDTNFDACSVTLRTGEVYCGDVLIGADGVSGLIRQRLMEENPPSVSDLRTLGPKGLAVYSAVIPKAVAMEDPELVKLYTGGYGSHEQHLQKTMVTFWMGSTRGAQAFLAGKDEDVVFWVYTPDSSQDGTWTKLAERTWAEILGPCDRLISRLAALAGPATCVQIKNHPALASWVSDSGRVAVLGEAAHPFPIISLHTYSIAIEDGAFIGQIFSHTQSAARVPEFLNAFEEHRKNRCVAIAAAEMQYIDVMALPDGEMQAGRDAAMRANEAAGRNVMDSGDDTGLQQMWDEMRMIFGYDPRDDADEWWVSWGRMRNRDAARDDPTTSKGKNPWRYSHSVSQEA